LICIKALGDVAAAEIWQDQLSPVLVGNKVDLLTSLSIAVRRLLPCHTAAIWQGLMHTVIFVQCGTDLP